MKKKTFLAVCAVLASTAMCVGLTACDNSDNNGGGGLSAEEAATKIAGFTTSPNTVNATFKQTFKLDVNDDREGLDNFRKDVADTVELQIDYTAGNLYYYAKKTTKDNKVTEQLVVKEDTTYSYLTTTTAKQTLADEAAAKTKIDELLSSFTKANSGYIDGKAFVYSANWVHDYILLGSSSITGTEKSYFTYAYDKAEGDGLKIDMDMKYVGYYTDGGSSEIGTDATHTGAKASVTTNSKGYITSFSETMNNHLDMPIAEPPFPLDYTGTRSLTATYDGAITKKAAADIAQNLEPGTITVPTVDHATVVAGDLKVEGFVFTEGTTVEVGHYVAVKVTPENGYEVSKVTINGREATLMGVYYCIKEMPAESGAVYNVAVVVKKTGEEAPSTVVNINKVEDAEIKLLGLDYSTMSYRDGAVEPGEFICVQIIPKDETKNYITEVTLDGKPFTDMTANWQKQGNKGMLFCYMDFTAENKGAAVANGIYDVTVSMKEKATVNVNEVEGATVKIKGLNYGATMVYRDGEVAVGEFICVQIIPADATKDYTATVTLGGKALTDMTANWQKEGNEGMLFCYMDFTAEGRGAAASGVTYDLVVTLTQA